MGMRTCVLVPRSGSGNELVQGYISRWHPHGERACKYGKIQTRQSPTSRVLKIAIALPSLL